jgi:hypothetical protein
MYLKAALITESDLVPILKLKLAESAATAIAAIVYYNGGCFFFSASAHRHKR